MNIPKLIVITGPTSSGKTDLSIVLAKEFNGEIVSADSRQVYRGLDIGTNKVSVSEMEGVAHHLIDVIDPDKQMTLAEYKVMADAAIEDIISRGKLPFLVGGSPLYVRAVVYNYEIPEVAPDDLYRARLEEMSLETLLLQLEQEDPETYAVIDRKNRRRVERALEVVHATGKSFSAQKTIGKSRYNALLLAREWPREELYERIDTCLDQRLARGLIEEVSGLLERGMLIKERLLQLGLEYRFVSRYLSGEFSKEEMVQKLKFTIHDFARRQLIWFRKETRIHWVKYIEEARGLVEEFLDK